MIIDMEEHAKHRQELRDEINLLKDKIYEFKKYLDWITYNTQAEEMALKIVFNLS